MNKKKNYTMKNRSPMASISVRGDIGFNKAARKILGLGDKKVKWLKLFLDKEFNHIGITVRGNKKFASGVRIQKRPGEARITALSLFDKLCECPKKKKGIYKIEKYDQKFWIEKSNGQEIKNPPKWYIQL